MAPQFKGILKYQCLEAGWSETYWLRGPDGGTAGAQLQNINGGRMGLSRSDVSMVDAVVVDAANPRVAYHPDISAGGWQLTGTYAVGGITVTPDLAILVRAFSADDSMRTRWFVRGFPSDQFGAGAGGPDATFTYQVSYLTALLVYRNSLALNAVMVHRTGPQAFTSQAIARTGQSTAAHVRRAGRPFNLRRGRRRIA